MSPLYTNLVWDRRANNVVLPIIMYFYTNPRYSQSRLKHWRTASAVLTIYWTDYYIEEDIILWNIIYFTPMLWDTIYQKEKKKGYNPEFPVFSRARTYVLVKHLFHLAGSMSRNWSTRCRKHRLTITTRIISLFLIILLITFLQFIGSTWTYLIDVLRHSICCLRLSISSFNWCLSALSCRI